MVIHLTFAAVAAVALIALTGPAQAQQNVACTPAPGVSQAFPIPTIVEFDSGSTKIKPADQQKIAKLATEAKAKYITQICVTGYADKQGDAKKNEQLSAARANAVAAELRKNGIDPKTLVISGKGEALGSTLSGVERKSQAERRVEIKVAR